MDYVLMFSIEDLPLMTNNLLRKNHWFITKEKNKWYKLVYENVFDNLPKRPMDKANLRLVRHSSSEPDYDGLVSGFKYIIDALVAHKVLVGDRPSNISPTYHWRKSKRSEGYVEITISGTP